MAAIPDKVETERGDWYKEERREIDILYDLVEKFNQLVDYLQERESTPSPQPQKEK